MQKSIKGALAGGAAAALLLGGAGSLAYWTSDGTVAGGDIQSGTLSLGSPTCDGWTLDGGGAFNLTTGRIVPGDALTQVCTFTVTAIGDHISADFDVTAAGALSGGTALDSALQLDASYEVNDSPVTPPNVDVSDGDVVKATIEVDFPYGVEDNSTKSLTATLDDITITATQTHTP